MFQLISFLVLNNVDMLAYSYVNIHRHVCMHILIMFVYTFVRNFFYAASCKCITFDITLNLITSKPGFVLGYASQGYMVVCINGYIGVWEGECAQMNTYSTIYVCLYKVLMIWYEKIFCKIFTCIIFYVMRDTISTFILRIFCIKRKSVVQKKK